MKDVQDIDSPRRISSGSSDSSITLPPQDEQISTPQDVDVQLSIRPTTTQSSLGPPFSIFTPGQKKFIVFMASWAGFFSPVSANIYFPALNALAADLHVSNTLINLTLTSYMIFQGLAPAFIGSLADSMGRRPAYTLCFVIYIAANIGLALQNSYPALFVLRCVQSTGSSATVAMASAVVADVATPAERGSYMGFTLAGSLLGPAIGPVLGGVLAEFLGWRSIFWFLVIFSGAFLTVFLIFFPETARGTVGNGSIPPQGWNMSLMNYLAVRKARRESSTDPTNETKELPPKKKFRFPNPLASLIILVDKQTALLLIYNAFLFAAFYDITAIIPSTFSQIYTFNDLQIGLCYIPIGVGAMLAALINGQLLDRNFARWCNKTGVQIKKGRDQDLSGFPIERARLEVAMPAAYVASVLTAVFGWLLDKEVHLAGILVVLFVTAFSMCIAFNVTSTLLVDLYPRSPATATAANNLARCLLGAGATGVVVPMVNGMGRGWTFTFLALVLLVASPMVWVVVWKGPAWREERKVKGERKQAEAEKRRASKVEEGQMEAESEKTPGLSESVTGEREHERGRRSKERECE